MLKAITWFYNGYRMTKHEQWGRHSYCPCWSSRPHSFVILLPFLEYVRCRHCMCCGSASTPDFASVGLFVSAICPIGA